MLDNMDLMLQRGDKIEEGLIKGQQLQTVSSNYKKRAVKVNKKMKCRYYCYWFWIVFVCVVAAAFLIAWIAGAFKGKDDNSGGDSGN